MAYTIKCRNCDQTWTITDEPVEVIPGFYLDAEKYSKLPFYCKKPECIRARNDMCWEVAPAAAAICEWEEGQYVRQKS